MLELSQQTSAGLKSDPGAVRFSKTEPRLRKPMPGLNPGNPSGKSSLVQDLVLTQKYSIIFVCLIVDCTEARRQLHSSSIIYYHAHNAPRLILCQTLIK